VGDARISRRVDLDLRLYNHGERFDWDRAKIYLMLQYRLRPQPKHFITDITSRSARATLPAGSCAHSPCFCHAILRWLLLRADFAIAMITDGWLTGADADVSVSASQPYRLSRTEHQKVSSATIACHGEATRARTQQVALARHERRCRAHRHASASHAALSSRTTGRPRSAARTLRRMSITKVHCHEPLAGDTRY
jgi:hypothetical protein